MKSLAIIIGFLLTITLATTAGKVEKVYKFGNPSVRHSGEYQILDMGNAMLTAMPGQPALPYRQVKLMLPPGESATGIEIIFSDEIIVPGRYNLYPQQEVRPISLGKSGAFLKDNAVYSKNITYPSDPKGQLVTAFLNGRSFALTTFTPVRYNPVTGKLSYYSHARVVVHTAPDAKASQALHNLSVNNNEPSKFADNIEMEKAYSTKKSTLINSYDLLIITPTEFAGSFGNLKASYLKEGITSLVVTRDSITSTMAGLDVPEKIRNFIIQEYQTHGIQYVLLGGDDEQIPHRGFYCYVISGSGYTDQNIPADIYYSALDGNWNTDGDAQWGEPGEDDLLPDIAVARMPFSNSAELANMLNKSYKYQFEPVAGEFRNIIMAGEYMYASPETWGSDYMELLKGEHSDNGYTTKGIPVDYSFDDMYDETSNWSGQDLMNHLNQGRPMLNHAGHANETYVMKLNNPDITNTNFSGLNGINHNFTIVYTHGCLCGAFDYNDCIAEKMVTIENFAAAFVGNSRFGWFNEGQTEGPSAHLHREYMDALYGDSLNRIGRAHMESKIATAAWVTAPGQWEPGALRWCFYDCNVLGDPALAVFTDNSITVNTTYPSTVLIGSPSMNVSVTSGGIPAPGLSCVAIKNGILLGKGITDASGQAVINFDVMVQDQGDAQLFVSGYNCTPVTYNFAFLAVAGPYVVHASSIVNDPMGNQNNQPDYGETILLTNGMRNVGGTNASNVMVTLSTADPYISITDSTELYSSVPVGDTVTIANAFTFKISDTVPDNHEVHFILKAVSGATWVSDFTINCNAPVLAVGGLIIDDLSGGNGNGRLDPGETATFIIPSLNNGGSTCINTTGTISTTSPWITIAVPVYQLGTIAGGTAANAVFTVQVSNDAPASSIVELEYVLSSGGYHASAFYYPTIRLIVEDFEAGNFTEFPWTSFGQYLWTITNVSPLEGVYCSRSAQISDNKESSMSITLNILGNDSISFYTKVSSEETFDKLKFLIDNQPMQEWSGILPWQRYSYFVNAGVHTFKWMYTKDMTTSGGSDCAWVDFIVFPAFVDYTGIKKMTAAGMEMNISPNPADEIITIHANLKSKCDLDITIYNSEGKAVLTSGTVSSDINGQLIMDLNVSELKAGLYSCILKAGETTVSRSIILY